MTKKNSEFTSNTKPKNPSMIKEKENIITSATALLKGREIVSNAFENKLLSLPLSKSEQVSQKN